jgi:hypothetical protein
MFLAYFTIQKQHLIRKRTFRNVKNGMKMFEFLKYHNSLITFPASDIYSPCLTAGGI